MISFLEAALTIIFCFETIAMLTSLYMFYNYVIKPRKTAKTGIKISPTGLTFIADMKVYSDGVYSGTYTNMNLSKLGDDFLNKITGYIPKGDINSIIKHSVNKYIQEETEAIVNNALDRTEISKLLAQKVDAALQEALK